MGRVGQQLREGWKIAMGSVGNSYGKGGAITIGRGGYVRDKGGYCYGKGWEIGMESVGK